MRVPLTIEHAAGELGTLRYRLPERKSPGEISPSSMMVQSDNVASPISFTYEHTATDGTQEIELPPTIVKGVQAVTDVEHTPRLRTSSGHCGKSLGSAGKSAQSLQSRPWSQGSVPQHYNQWQRTSMSQSFALYPVYSAASATSTARDVIGTRNGNSLRGTSTDRWNSDKRVNFAIVPTAPSCVTSLKDPDPVNFRRNIPRSSCRRTRYQRTKEHRIREEQTEAAMRLRLDKSWWTSWMFKKPNWSELTSCRVIVNRWNLSWIYPRTRTFHNPVLTLTRYHLWVICVQNTIATPRIILRTRCFSPYTCESQPIS